MRRRSKKPVLQVLTKSVGDRESNDQRGYAGSDADNRDRRDHSNHGLAALGPEISRRDEEFKAHCKAEYNSAIGPSGDRVIGLK